MSNILSVITFLPIVGVLLLLFIPKESNGVLRSVALVTTLATFLVTLPIITGFQTNAEYQFVENVPWIAAGPFAMRYNIGIDGISFWLVVLTNFIMPIAVLSTWTAVEDKVKEYMICLLLLQTGMLGAFISLDLFLFYIFWEVMLIPMFLSTPWSALCSCLWLLSTYTSWAPRQASQISALYTSSASR